MTIPYQVLVTNQTGLISAPWITFFNGIINKYNPDLMVKLADVATANTYDLPATNSGMIVDNVGCSAIQTVNLPVAITGIEYRVICSENHAIHLKPQSGELIDGASTTGKYLSLDSIGVSAYLICVNFGKWHILSSHGTTSFET